MPKRKELQAENMREGNFAENLRDALKSAGLTQAELAHRAGCTQPDISRYLTAGRIPSGDKLVEMAQALETTAERLINGRAVAYNSLELPERTAAARVGRDKRLRRLVGQVSDALGKLRAELEGEA